MPSAIRRVPPPRFARGRTGKAVTVEANVAPPGMRQPIGSLLGAGHERSMSLLLEDRSWPPVG